MDNPERFLGEDSVNQGANGNQIENGKLKMENPEIAGQMFDNDANHLSPEIPQQNQPNFDVNTLALLLGLLQQVNKEKGDKAKPEDFINVLENVLAQEQEG